MSDFESELARRLNASVDERVGSRHAAPPFGTDGRAPDPARRSRWLYPLLAACLVLAVGAAIAAVHLTAHHPARPVAPPTRPPTTAPNAPRPTAGVTPSSTATTPSATVSTPASTPPPHRLTSSASSTAARTNVVRLGAASISLPAGWVARDYQRYLTGGQEVGGPTWCLTPATLPVSTAPRACPVELNTVDPTAEVDANIEGGYLSNPEYCGPASPLYRSFREQSADKSFGGRAADWRRWDIECTTNGTWQLEQYVVATGPGYILRSERADATVHAAMAEIAANSHLPAQTLPVRFFDSGFLRSADRTSAGVRVSIDRIEYQDGKVVDDNPRAYDYLVPTSVFDAAGRKLTIGEHVYLWSDGHRVRGISGADPPL